MNKDTGFMAINNEIKEHRELKKLIKDHLKIVETYGGGKTIQVLAQGDYFCYLHNLSDEEVKKIKELLK